MTGHGHNVALRRFQAADRVLLNDSTRDIRPDTEMAERLGLNKRSGGRRRWWWIGGGAVLLIIVLWFIFGGHKPPAYDTKPVTRGALDVTVSATGTLAPRDQVDVGAEVSGRIDALLVDFNDHVTKGEVLARINTDQLKAQLDQANATLANAQATLQQTSLTARRYEALAKTNSISAEQLNTARGDYARAKGTLALAQATVQSDQTMLSKATIYSPISGVVLDKKVSAGQTVVAAFQIPVLFTLASDLSQMELDVDIDEADVGAVRVGQNATFTVDAYPNRDFTAKLTSIHNAPQTVQGVVTYRGVLVVPNPNLLLKPGMTATAEIMAARVDDALLVPNAALRFVAPDDASRGTPPASTEANRGRVWTVDGSTLKFHDLKLGATDGRSTQVLSGDVKPGDQLVTAAKTPDAKAQ
ncbi:MAG TPA: efflux RND transporter periplasmic adaptor subunit [Rhizomicrobium sp.]|nr:efflux RND transporter periplasmic adaptor subunit [Rhizomicrobium sp.]